MVIRDGVIITLFILCLKWSNSSRNAKKNFSPLWTPLTSPHLTVYQVSRSLLIHVTRSWGNLSYLHLICINMTIFKLEWPNDTVIGIVKPSSFSHPVHHSPQHIKYQIYINYQENKADSLSKPGSLSRSPGYSLHSMLSVVQTGFTTTVHICELGQIRIWSIGSNSSSSSFLK